MRKLDLPLLAAFVALLVTVAKAAPQGQPLPKVGTCPFGYYGLGSYCVPSNAVKSREAIQKVGNSCPFGWYSAGSYCIQNQ